MNAETNHVCIPGACKTSLPEIGKSVDRTDYLTGKTRKDRKAAHRPSKYAAKRRAVRHRMAKATRRAQR